jgi:hypothetical protein
MRLEQADQLVAGRHRLTRQHAPLALRNDPLDQRPVVVDAGQPECGRAIDPGHQPRRRLLQIAQGGPGGADQLAIQLHPPGSTADELDVPCPLLRRATMIAPESPARPNNPFASCSKRSRLLSLGSCISAAVTVLLRRTTRPCSSCASAALDRSVR